jgi:hypothetical protein
MWFIPHLSAYGVSFSPLLLGYNHFKVFDLGSEERLGGRVFIHSVVERSEFLASDPEVRARFSAQPDFRRNSRPGTGPLSLVNTIEELLGRKSSGSGLESREYGRMDPPR